MTKRQVRQAAHQAIVKEGKSHQETFDELRIKKSLTPDELAAEVSKIPSGGKSEKTKVLRYVLLGLLGLIILLRVAGILLLGQVQGMSGNLILIMVALGIVVPAIGIYAVIASKVELYMTVAILLCLAIFRSFTKGQMDLSPISLVTLIPFAGAIILLFVLPQMMKTKFEKKVIKEDGRSSIQYVFEDSRLKPNEILD